jgi:hypothetical protein
MITLSQLFMGVAIVGVPVGLARLLPPCRTATSCMLEASVFGILLAGLEYVVTPPFVARALAMAIVTYSAVRVLQGRPFSVAESRSGYFDVSAIERSAHLWPMCGLALALLVRRMEAPAPLVGTCYFTGLYGAYIGLQSRVGGKLMGLLCLFLAGVVLAFEG